MNGTLACSFIQVPPRSNASISQVSFLQGRDFFVFIIKGFVLIMDFQCDQLLGVSIQKLNPLEKIGPLIVNHLDNRNSSPLNNVNNIPICLCTIRHEPLENGCTQPFLLNNYVQLPPQNALNFYVFKLHVIDHNYHDLVVHQVINMRSHGRPSLNSFYMIEHHPYILQIITQLLSLDHIKYGCNSTNKHLEQINFLPNLLTRKTIVLNIIVTKQCLQFQDIVNGARVIKTMLQWNNEIAYAKGTQKNKL